MTKFFTPALLVLLILAACNKTPTPQLPGRDSMLRTGKWKISGGTFTKKNPLGIDDTLSYLDFIPECHKDDYIIFDSQMHAAVYSGSAKCNPSDAEFIPFVWQLKNGGNSIDLYNGFNNLYSSYPTILPYKFDTLLNDGSTLILDTVIGAVDTPMRGTFIVLDTIWEYRMDTVPTPQISIYNAQITNFSQRSFNLHFSVISTYPDGNDNHWLVPVIKPDTMRYIVTYSNF